MEHLRAILMGEPAWSFHAPEGGGGEVGSEKGEVRSENGEGGSEEDEDGGGKDGEGGEGNRAFTQSELDRAVSRAVETREKRLKADFERQQREAAEAADRKRMEEEKRFEDLYKTEAQKRAALELQSGTLKALSEKGLSSMGYVFDEDTSTVEGRAALAERLKGDIDAEVERRVQERLKNTAPPGSGRRSGSGGGITAEEVEKMTPGQYAEARRKGLIK